MIDPRVGGLGFEPSDKDSGMHTEFAFYLAPPDDQVVIELRITKIVN